ncbi:F-box only protein 28-like [Saccoglossus kowalevskii]|uniref:F-box only protein 28-like n=1 Tax=Saccoglossus kowalevskii TaxID=10224 RepID=A0ABM0GQP4_SACKO|nr:PREDICTED: F-box only protein 28-like [Saccoglossus kowalevskii]
MEVSKIFDELCQELLNHGYSKVDRYHSSFQKELKSRLPRRESERRNHPLARHCDILAAIETRLSLLGMTFMKYVDMKLCCFIPGKVLDEIMHLINYIRKTPNPPRAHELLQELRDISSMAMEYFDEKIVPTLRRNMPHPSEYIITNPSMGISSGSAACSSGVVAARRQDLIKLQAQLKVSINNLLHFRKEFLEHKKELLEHKKKNSDQEKRIQKQEQVITDLNNKICVQDRKLNEMNRKFVDYDQKFEDLTAEIGKLTRISTERLPGPLKRKRKCVDLDEGEQSSDKPIKLRTSRPREKKQKHSSN